MLPTSSAVKLVFKLSAGRGFFLTSRLYFVYMTHCSRSADPSLSSSAIVATDNDDPSRIVRSHKALEVATVGSSISCGGPEDSRPKAPDPVTAN